MGNFLKTLGTVGMLSCGSLFAATPTSKSKDATPSSNPNYIPIEAIDNPSWYVGAAYEVGNLFSSSQSFTNRENNPNDSKDTGTGTLNTPGMGFQAFIGYNCNRYFAVELQYEQILSREKETLVITHVPDTNNTNLTETAYREQIVFGPFFLFNVPISRYFTPYFKAGMSTLYLKETLSGTYTTGGAAFSDTRSFWAEHFGYGVGIKSQIVQNFGLRLEYQDFFGYEGYGSWGNLSLAGYVSF